MAVSSSSHPPNLSDSQKDTVMVIPISTSLPEVSESHVDKPKPASLSTCPLEVVLRILGFTDRFSTVAALVVTSHHFCGLWDAMSNKILPRLLESYEDLLELVNVQEQVDREQVRDNDIPKNHHVSLVCHISRLAANERIMVRALYDFQDVMGTNLASAMVLY